MIGKVTDQLCRFPELTGINHQIKDEVVPRQRSETRAPSGMPHKVPVSRKTTRRVLTPAQNVAYADNSRKRDLRVEQLKSLGAREWYVHDILCAHAAGLLQRFQPLGFSEAVTRIPAGFDMHRGDDIVARGVAKVVARKIVPPQLREIAEAPATHSDISTARRK